MKLFKEQATLLKKHGAAVLIMAFEEDGQAATESEKVRIICKRSYNMLVNEIRLPLEDIVFDPNALTIRSRMKEHANYGVDFINAVKTIKEQYSFSGGTSKLSFGFRECS